LAYLKLWFDAIAAQRTDLGSTAPVASPPDQQNLMNTAERRQLDVMGNTGTVA
jgi:hypothetical protein